jgi:hypothetical protein
MAEAVACDSCHRVFHVADVESVGENNPIQATFLPFAASLRDGRVSPVLSFPWPKTWRHVCCGCRDEIFVRGMVLVADQMPEKVGFLRGAVKSMEGR